MNEDHTRQRELDEMSIASDFSIIPESMAGAPEEGLDALGSPSSLEGGSSTRSNGGQPFLKSMDFKPQPEAERAFGKVLFQNIQATYGPETDVPVSYVLTESITAKPSDRIALYKVGFSSPHDYLTYQWAQVPTQDHISNSLPMTVIFRANSLPKECGEFFQFCYMSHEGHIVGVSVPFQLVAMSSLGGSSLCQVEDEEEEGLVFVKTHESLMQDRLSKLQAQHEQLQGESSSQFQQMEDVQSKLADKTQQLNMCQHHLQALEVKMKRETSEKCELMGRVGQVVEEKGHLEDKMRTLERSVTASKIQIEQLQDQNQKVTDEKDQYLKEVSALNEKEQKLQESLRETQTQLSQSNEESKKLSEELLKTKNEHQQAVAQLEFWTSTATTDKNEKDSLAIKYSTLNEELFLRNKELENLRKDKGELEERLSCLVIDLTSVREEAANNQEQISTFEEKLGISEDRQKVVHQDNNCYKDKIKELSAQIEQLKEHQVNSESGREAAERIAGDLSARLQTAKAEYHNLALLNLKLTKKIKRSRNNSESRKDSIMENSVISQQSSWLQVAADDGEDAEEDEEKLHNEEVEGATAAQQIRCMSQSCYSGFTSGTGCSSCSQSTKELTESVNRKMEDIVKGLSQQIESLKVQLLVAKATGSEPDTAAVVETTEAEELPQLHPASETCQTREDQTRNQQKEGSPETNISDDASESCKGATGGGEQQQVLYSKSFLPAQQTAPVFLPEITNSNNSLQVEGRSSSECGTLPSAPSPTPSMRSANNEGVSRSASAASAAAAATAAMAAASASGLPSAPPYIQQGVATESAQAQNLDTSDIGMDLNGLHAPLLPETTHTARQAAVMSQFVMQSAGVIGGAPGGVHDSDDEDFHSTSGAEDSHLQPEAQDYLNGHLIQCPMCSLSFQPGAMRLLEEHINSHLEHVCPICSQAFQRNNQAKFEEHVHTHFEDGEDHDEHPDTTGPWSVLSRAQILEID